MASITTDTNLSSLSLTPGEAISVSNGAVLTIDASFSDLGSISSSLGTVLLKNLSTATPIVLSFQDNTKDFGMSGGSEFVAEGLPINIHSGTGLANQIIDFSNIGGVSIDYPTYTEVETGSGTGVYEIWPTVPIGGSTGSFVHAKTDFTNGEIGKVVFFDTSTQEMSCGDGTNGTIFPSGANVRIPNIHITSAVTVVSVGSRSQFRLDAGGNCNIAWMSLSDAIYNRRIESDYAYIRQFGFAVRINSTSNLRGLDLENICSSLDPRDDENVNSFTGVIGEFRLVNFRGVHPGNSALSITNVAGATEIKNIRCWMVERTQTYLSLLRFSVLPSTCEIDDIRVYGSLMIFVNIVGCTITNIKHSDTCNGQETTIRGVNIIRMDNCSDLIIRGVELELGGSPCYSSLFLYNSVDNTIVRDVDYDANSHSAYLMNGKGYNLTFSNIDINDVRNPAILSSTGISNIDLKNVMAGDKDSTITLSGGRYEYLQSTALLNSTPNYPNAGHFNVLVSDDKTTGAINVGAWGDKGTGDSYDIISGNPTTQGNGRFLFPVTGDEVIFNSQFPIRGVTGFSAIEPTYSGSNQATLDYSFEIVNSGDSFSGTWTALNATNLQTAFSALVGRDSDIGIDIRIRVVAPSDISSRYLRRFRLYTTNDPLYIPVTGEANVNISGVLDGSFIALYDISGADKLVSSILLSGATEATLKIPYEFDGNPLPYKVRIVKYGYDTLETTGNVTQRNNDLPISQSDYQTLTEPVRATVDAYTSIDNSQEFDDVLRAWTEDNPLTAPIKILSRFGDTVDISPYDVVIDPLAVGALDVSGNVITIKSSAYTGSITTTGDITDSDLVVDGIKTDSNGTSAKLEITGLSDVSLLVQDGSDNTIHFAQNFTGDYSLRIASGEVGTWKWAVKKSGITHATGSFIPSGGGVFLFSPSTTQILTPEGDPMYTGSSSSLVDVSFTGTTQANIDIGNGAASLQATYNETERALITEDGLKWLISGKGDCSQFNGSSGDFFFMSTGWRLRVRTAGDNSIINAFAQSTDGIPVDNVNGPVSFLSSDSPTAIASAVWAHLLSEAALDGSASKTVQDVLREARAAVALSA